MSKIILVTGGNRGIGLEICKQLAEHGHTVLLGSRDLSRGNKASRNLQGNVIVKQLDVTSEESISNLAKEIEKEYNKLDVLINNAGIGVGSNGVVKADHNDVKQTMETNFYGPWRVSQIMLPLLKKSDDGRIVNMSSGMGALSDLVGGYAGYRLSKTSLNALTIQMSSELSNVNIKVNAMCPGWVRTDMGGPSAPRHVSKGAETAVWLSLEEKISTGKFFRDKKVIDW